MTLIRCIGEIALPKGYKLFMRDIVAAYIRDRDDSSLICSSHRDNYSDEMDMALLIPFQVSPLHKARASSGVFIQPEEITSA